MKILTLHLIKNAVDATHENYPAGIDGREYVASRFALDGTTITAEYQPDQLSRYETAAKRDGDTYVGVIHDLARFLGTFSDSKINTLKYNTLKNGETVETEFTWNSEGTLKGSNWEDEEGNTLISTIAERATNENVQPIIENGLQLTFVHENGVELPITFKFTVTE